MGKARTVYPMLKKTEAEKKLLASRAKRKETMTTEEIKWRIEACELRLKSIGTPKNRRELYEKDMLHANLVELKTALERREAKL